MNIRINGEPRDIADGLTIADLLKTLELDPRYLAVERNKTLVPRRQHADCRIEDGDQLEIVTLVGGG